MSLLNCPYCGLPLTIKPFDTHYNLAQCRNKKCPVPPEYYRLKGQAFQGYERLVEKNTDANFTK